jgi:hypothetical protein
MAITGAPNTFGLPPVAFAFEPHHNVIVGLPVPLLTIVLASLLWARDTLSTTSTSSTSPREITPAARLASHTGERWTRHSSVRSNDGIEVSLRVDEKRRVSMTSATVISLRSALRRTALIRSRSRAVLASCPPKERQNDNGGRY